MSAVIEHRSIGDLAALSQFPPVLQRVLSARNVVDPETMEYGLSQLLPFDDLLNIIHLVNKLSIYLII